MQKIKQNLLILLKKYSKLIKEKDERRRKMLLKNILKHFCLITHHKWVVFKLCCKIGEPWRGLVHDLSKYSPTEFFESVKY